MSSVPPAGSSRLPPVPAGAASPAPPQASSADTTSLASLWLQSQVYQQLADIAAQQAAAQMKAKMAASASTAPVSAVASLMLNHDSLKNLNEAIGGLSSILAQARLLSESNILRGDSGSDYDTQVAELNALGKGLADLLEGMDACGSMSTDDGTPLTLLQDNIIKALGALPPSQLGVILYAALYKGDTSVSQSEFDSKLADLAQGNSPLAPLAKHAMEATPIPCPVNGKWTAGTMNQLTFTLSNWFKSPSSDNPNGYWGKMQAAGLAASLTPWIQALGQNGNAARNTDIGCLQTASLAMLAIVDVGGDSSVFNAAYATGGGMTSLGFFMAIELATYFANTVGADGDREKTIGAQLDKLIAEHQKSAPNDIWCREMDAIKDLALGMTGSDPLDKPLPHPSDTLAAPWMALLWGGVPKQLTRDEALAEALSLFTPERIKAIADWDRDKSVEAGKADPPGKDTALSGRYKETRG